jgi:hypothetical protein
VTKLRDLHEARSAFPSFPIFRLRKCAINIVNGLKKGKAGISRSAPGHDTLVIVPSRLGRVSLDTKGEESDMGREKGGDASVGHYVEDSKAAMLRLQPNFAAKASC